jgi:hypothetical protein
MYTSAKHSGLTVRVPDMGEHQADQCRKYRQGLGPGFLTPPSLTSAAVPRSYVLHSVDMIGLMILI